jgi:15-cis-phytoene synthase
VRVRTCAFGCLVHEIEQAAFNLSEPQVAAVKLAWWRQELLGAIGGNPRHPLSKVLFADSHCSIVDAAQWGALIDGAMSMLDLNSASNLDELLAGYAALYTPVAAIEVALADSKPTHTSTPARWWTISHLLQAARHLVDAPERLPVPMDLLARHELTRAGLAQPGVNRDAMLRDYLGALAEILRTTLNQSFQGTLARRVRAKLDLALIDKIIRSPQPFAQLQAPPRALRWKTVWWTWREARRPRRRTET